MRLSAKLAKALNDQINLELCSAYAYLGMAAYFDHTVLTGFGRWMAVQCREELDHAERFYKYIVDRGGKVTLGALPVPKTDYQSALEAFQASLAHEQKVSAAISDLYDLAAKEKDFATVSFLKWFLDEQVEEEKSVGEYVSKLEMIGENRNGLYHLDRHAAKRGESK